MPGEYEVRWSSTSEERYDTDMVERAEGIAESLGCKPLVMWGGYDFETQTCDNGMTFRCDEGKANAIRLALTQELKREVDVRQLVTY